MPCPLKRRVYTFLIHGVSASNIRGGFDGVVSWSGSAHSDAMVQRKGVRDESANSRVQKIVNPGSVRGRDAADRARRLNCLNHLHFLILSESWLPSRGKPRGYSRLSNTPPPTIAVVILARVGRGRTADIALCPKLLGPLLLLREAKQRTAVAPHRSITSACEAGAEVVVSPS